MAEMPLIEREEVVAPLFNVGNIVVLLDELVSLAGGGDGEEEDE